MVTKKDIKRTTTEIFAPVRSTLDGLLDEGFDNKGVLNAGVMLFSDLDGDAQKAAIKRAKGIKIKNCQADLLERFADQVNRSDLDDDEKNARLELLRELKERVETIHNAQ